MPLTVENGTGVEGADSFITAAEYESTLLDLFGEVSAADEPALRRAFIFMRTLQWKADYPFPTMGGVVPLLVKQAQAIFARHEVTNAETLQPSVVPGQQKILTSVGEIGWTPTGQTGVEAQKTVVTMALGMLTTFINGTSGTRFLERA